MNDGYGIEDGTPCDKMHPPIEPSQAELAAAKETIGEYFDHVQREEALLIKFATIIAQHVRVEGHDAAYWKLQCDEMVKTMGDLPKHLAVEIKRADAAEAKLAKIKSENSVTWHEAAILAAQNRDAKLKERDQLRAELATKKAAVLREAAAKREALDLMNSGRISDTVIWLRAEADRIEAGKESVK